MAGFGFYKSMKFLTLSMNNLLHRVSQLGLEKGDHISFRYMVLQWTLRTVDEQALRVFERKVLHRIYGPVCIQGEWRLRTNAELDNLLGHADLVRFIKSQRFSWLGHIERMEEKQMPNKILKDKMHGTERKGRPRQRWIDVIEQDLRTMGVRGLEIDRNGGGLLERPRYILDCSACE
jgi:hypothetical protein